jgi:type IV secretory pathway VirB3-like protein
MSEAADIITTADKEASSVRKTLTTVAIVFGVAIGSVVLVMILLGILALRIKSQLDKRFLQGVGIR